MATAGLSACTPCSRRSEDTEAAVSVTCKICNQNFCKACLESHDTIFGVNNHDMSSVFREPSAPMAAADARDTRAMMCPLHPLEAVTMFCFPHNAVFCQMCKSTQHRECIGVEYITAACRGFCRSANTQAQKHSLDGMLRRLVELKSRHSHDWQHLAISIYLYTQAQKHSLDGTLRRLVELKSLRSHDQQRLGKEKEVMLASISAFRCDMNRLLDALESSAVDQVERQFGSMSNQIVADLLHCDRLIATMEHLSNLYSNSSGENEAYQLFVFDKECSRAVDGGKQTAAYLESNVGRDTIHAELDTSLEDILKRSSFLKTDEKWMEGEGIKGSDELSDKSAAAGVVGGALAGIEGVDADHIKVVGTGFVNVADVKEKECTISGICQLSDGWFVLVDRENTKVKLLNEELELVSSNESSQWPTKPCESGPGEVSVGLEYLSNGAIVQYECVTQCNGVRTLYQKAKIKLRHYCLGLVYQDGMYYMADFGGKVHCYNRAGTFVKTVYKGDDVKDMTMGLDQITLFIVDKYKGVEMVTLGDSALIPQATMVTLKKPVAVTPKDMDSVFVADRSFMNVMIMDKTGHVSSPLLPFDPNREHIKAVCYDAKKNRLIISYHLKTKIEVITLVPSFAN